MTGKNIVSRTEIEDLLHAYIAAIDDDRLEEWPDFFTENCEYQIIPRENADLDLPAAIIYCDSKGMLKDRIVALRKANIFPEHYCRHIISGTRITGMNGDLTLSESNYVVFQTRMDGETKIYNAGKYIDKIRRVDGTLRYESKKCVFDTHLINTLMVTPI